MDFYFTYQLADTVRTKNLLDLNSSAAQSGGLNAGRSAILPMEIQDEARQPIQTRPAPQRTSASQGRYFRNREEEKLLVNGSRTITPIEEYTIGKVQLIDRGIMLPEQMHRQVNYDWVTAVLALCLFMFATVRIPYSKYLGQMFQSLVNYPSSTRLFRERNYAITHGAFRLDIYFYFVFSMFIFLAIKYNTSDLPLPDVVMYLLCVVAVFLYFMLKRGLYFMTGMAGNGQALASEYWFNVDNYNRALGLFLFPIVAVAAFSPSVNQFYLIVVGLSITVIFYGMALQRGILILLKKQFSIFYLFLYLCTLEILPLVLIFKMVMA